MFRRRALRVKSPVEEWEGRGRGWWCGGRLKWGNIQKKTMKIKELQRSHNDDEKKKKNKVREGVARGEKGLASDQRTVAISVSLKATFIQPQFTIGSLSCLEFKTTRPNCYVPRLLYSNQFFSLYSFSFHQVFYFCLIFSFLQSLFFHLRFPFLMIVHTSDGKLRGIPIYPECCLHKPRNVSAVWQENKIR